MEKIMSVNRYDGKVSHRDNGAYISYEDYAALETEHKSAMLTISAIMEILGVTDSISISEQVIALLEERDALAVENTGLKSYIRDECYVTPPNSGLMTEADTAAEDYMPETPATDAAIANVKVQARIEGAHFVANRMLAAWEAGFIEDTAKNAADIARMILTSTEFMPTAPEGDFDRSFADGVLEDIAAQLRKESEA